MSCNFLNSWVVFLAALSSLSSVAVGIRCLECNELPDGAARSPCPGAALINFGTKFDVSNECAVQRRRRGGGSRFTSRWVNYFGIGGFDYKTNWRPPLYLLQTKHLSLSREWQHTQRKWRKTMPPKPLSLIHFWRIPFSNIQPLLPPSFRSQQDK